MLEAWPDEAGIADLLRKNRFTFLMLNRFGHPKPLDNQGISLSLMPLSIPNSYFIPTFS